MKREVDQNDLVAQMSLGFWNAFLKKRYAPLIWQKKGVFEDVFPKLKGRNRNLYYIRHRMEVIKDVRNRIAHHEIILNAPVYEAHSYCYELIHAMSAEALEMLKSIDRFPILYDTLVKKPDNS